MGMVYQAPDTKLSVQQGTLRCYIKWGICTWEVLRKEHLLKGLTSLSHVHHKPKGFNKSILDSGEYLPSHYEDHDIFCVFIGQSFLVGVYM